MRRRILLESVVVLIGYALLACAITWPIPAELGTTLLGEAESDVGAGIWWYDALQQAGYHLWGTTHFAQIGFPLGVDASNGLNLQWLLPNYPTYLGAGALGEVTAYNLEILAGFTLSGAAMYLLARRLGCVPMVAMWAGLAWVVFPWHFERATAGHPSLVHLELLPLTLAAVHAAWMRPDARRMALVGLGVAGSWLTSGIFGVMMLVVVLVAAGVTAIAPRTRRNLRVGVALGGSAIAASGLVFLVSLPGGGDSGVREIRRAESLSIYGLRASELVVPAPRSIVFSKGLREFHESRFHGSNVQETSNYLGLLTIVLAAVWLVVAWRRRRTIGRALGLLTSTAAAGSVVALLLAMPSPVSIFGQVWERTPSYVLWKLVPGFRVPARWSVVVMLLLLTLAALALQAIWNRLKERRTDGAAGLPALAAVATAITISFLELSVAPSSFRFGDDRVPAEYAILARAPAGPLAEYPLVASDLPDNSQYLFWQRHHGRPLANGAALGTEGEAVRRSLVNPAGPGTASRLAALGVRVIITRPQTFVGGFVGRRAPAPPTWGAGYELVGATPTRIAVWKVVAPPATVIAWLSEPAFGKPAIDGGRIVQPLERASGFIELRSNDAHSADLVMELFARGAATRRVEIGDATILARPRGTQVRIRVRVSPGLTRVPIRSDDLPVGEVGLSVTTPLVVVRDDDPGK